MRRLTLEPTQIKR